MIHPMGFARARSGQTIHVLVGDRTTACGQVYRRMFEASEQAWASPVPGQHRCKECALALREGRA